MVGFGALKLHNSTELVISDIHSTIKHHSEELFLIKGKLKVEKLKEKEEKNKEIHKKYLELTKNIKTARPEFKKSDSLKIPSHKTKLIEKTNEQNIKKN